MMEWDYWKMGFTGASGQYFVKSSGSEMFVRCSRVGFILYFNFTILHKATDCFGFSIKATLLAELKQLKKFPCRNFWPNQSYLSNKQACLLNHGNLIALAKLFFYRCICFFLHVSTLLIYSYFREQFLRKLFFFESSKYRKSQIVVTISFLLCNET